jgi:hypothetical protein
VDKSLGDSLAGSTPAEEFGEGSGGQAVPRDCGEKDKHRQALAEVDVRDLLREAKVPASRRSPVFLRLAICEEERQLERLDQRDDWSSEAAESASVTFSRSRARRKRM